MDITTITLHRTDLAGDSAVSITVTEWERVCDLIEAAAKRADIEIETASYGCGRWVFDVDDADVGPINAIIESVIEGSLGQWTDAACLDAAVEFYQARRGRSGETWWGEGFAGIDDGVMADVGFLVLQDKKAAAGEILDAATQALDEDIHPDDLLALAEETFGLEHRPDGTSYSERFNALPTDAVVHAGRALRRGDEEEAIGILIDSDEADDEMDDTEAIGYAVDALGAEYDEETDTWYLLRGGELVFAGASEETMAEAGRGIRRDGNVGDWEDTLRYRSDFDY